MRTLRAWLYGGLAGLLAACGTQQGNVPDQPRGDSQVIVIGGPAKQPVQVAESEPEPAPVAVPNDTAKAADADLTELVIDPRKSRWSPRAFQLVVTEIQGLEALFASVPLNSPDRPRLMRRLAEDYYELVSASRRDKQNAKPLALRGDGRAAKDVERFERTSHAAQKKMLDYYDMLIQKHPDFCDSVNSVDPTKNRGCIDDALYFMGLEYQRMGSPDKARKSYFQLIKSFPASPWIPASYLAFGEFFFVEGNDDPTKLDHARQAYEKVVQFPPPQNEVLGFAHYRLAQIHKLKQDLPNAMSQLIKASEFVVTHPSLRSSPALGQTVRREVVPIYSLAGKPTKAEAFFKRFLSDSSAPGTDRHLVEMLNELVQLYMRDNKRVEANDVCFGFSGGAEAIPACSTINSVAGQQTP